MNWHAMTGDEQGNAFTIIFHIPIPAVNNRVGVSYRTALVNSGIGGRTAMVEGVAPGHITTAEKSQIEAGELYEHVEVVHSSPGETPAQIATKIDTRFGELTAAIQTRLQNQLTYFGHAQNAPAGTIKRRRK